MRLTAVESTLEGDMDVRGALGLSDEVRNGFSNLRVSFKVSGEAPPEKLRELVERAQARSVVFDMVTNGVPVEVGVIATRSSCSGGRSYRAPAAVREPLSLVMLELTANTDAGARLVRLAESLAQELARRAPEHDRAASFPHASVAALKEAGYFTAPIPAGFGGLGVTSVHDVVVASSRLARGDASVAIGVNMHFAVLLNMVRRWLAAVAAGDERRARAFGSSMQAIARDGVIMATAVSEPGQDLTRPSTTATRTESGWRIDGRKIFCTMSPAATVLQTAVTFAGDDGVERYGMQRSIPPPTACGSTTTGTRSACGPRAATP